MEIGKQRELIRKELDLVARQERALHKAAMKQKTPQWKSTLREKVPEPVCVNLEKAFGKAFALVFDRGTDWIEKTYKAEELQNVHHTHDTAFRSQADRKSLKQLRRGVKRDSVRSLLVTGAEGVGLGVLGIGLPDLVLFVGVLLQGVYKTALQYGFDYHSPRERVFILKIMEAAVQKGEAWAACDRSVEDWIAGRQTDEPTEAEQRTRTAQAFADDLLVAKFIQGLPLVGVIGGLSNPVCYRQVMKYAELKYRKRYLYGLYWACR